jgi:hypothetical protein
MTDRRQNPHLHRRNRSRYGDFRGARESRGNDRRVRIDVRSDYRAAEPKAAAPLPVFAKA